tara:strand:+ start:109 stop:474 length:366 start_codon:yes stop_codon:yes gene_type:complete
MKKLLSLIFVSLLLSGNGYAEDYPILECTFNDNNKTTTIFDLNIFEDKLMVSDNEYSWSREDIENGMKQLITMTIKRNSGYAELGVSKKFPVVSDLDVVMDAINNSDMTTGKCKKIKEQNL